MFLTSPFPFALAENESEESMHFFPTAGPSSGNEQQKLVKGMASEEASSPNKQSSNGGGSQQQQFDSILATLSGHLMVSETA